MYCLDRVPSIDEVLELCPTDVEDNNVEEEAE